ncbi:MAG: phosphoribosylformylglycinamidine synthase I, partial [Planctomycetota bacterium]
MARALVLQAAGINCDLETARAFELAGASADLRHVNTLDARDPFAGYDLLAIPGGFSYGDDVAAGRILGDRIVRQFGDALHRFVENGRPVLGICNGFQVLVSAGLLPGGNAERAALDTNVSGSFACRWVTLRRGGASSIWTADFAADEAIELPIAHAEGRLIGDEATIERHAAFTYAEPAQRLSDDLPANPNGSVADVAGLTDSTGLVMGLMPHPERYVEP